MENFDKIDVKNKISRNSYFYDNKIQYFKGQNYIKLKSECLKSGRLFEDPLFCPNSRNLYYSKQAPSNIKWLRPHQIVSKPDIPKFIVNTANSNDLDQGYLGNCWFIAGCAAVSLMPDLFDKVVPKSQTCYGDGYCGIFHFRFWIYGIWYDVTIDDYLPVWDYSNQLVFCSNKEEPNEFWAALLEKAYAKVCGSYENLEGGFTSDALIDMSGGLEETFPLDKRANQKAKEDLWKILCKSRELKSMNAAYIEPDPHISEEKLPNGLVKIPINYLIGKYKDLIRAFKNLAKGHAYTISKIALIENKNKEIRLIRLRNPWGRIEWKGSWSDNSPEWNQISDEVKNSLDFKKENEGEFWMDYDNFYYHFDSIQFCHMTPDSFSDEILEDDKNDKISWKMIAYHGEWIRNKSAGGSGNGGDKRFWSNPQFLIKLVDVDLNDNDNLATVVIALMQKFTREKRIEKNGYSAEEFIQFRLFRVKNDNDADKSIRYGEKLYDHQLERVGNSGNYINKREVTKRFKVPPGYYLIIPSTYDYNVEGEFLLRIFTEKLINESDSILLLNSPKSNSTSFFDSPTHNLDTGFKNFVSNISNSADRAFSSLNSSLSFAKSQFSANLKSQMNKMSLNDEKADNNTDNFTKEIACKIEKKSKPIQVCSVM